MKYDPETEVYELSNGKILEGIRPDYLTLVFVNYETGFFDDITNRITRKYPQQFLICIVGGWVLVAVDAGVRLQVAR
jgi:hypothetical protein